MENVSDTARSSIIKNMKILCTNMINNYSVALKKGLEEINYEGNSSIINIITYY